MDAPVFWDVVGPLCLFAFIMIFAWSLYGWKRKSFFILLICSMIDFGISTIFAWSIGNLLLIVPILQFIAAMYILIIKKNYYVEK